MALSPDLQQALLQTGLGSLQSKWTIPEVGVALNERERAHMFNHPIASIVMPHTKEDKDAILKQFCVSFLQAVCSKVAVSSLECAIADLTIEHRATEFELPDDLDLQDFNLDVDASLLEAADEQRDFAMQTTAETESFPTIAEATKDPSNSTMQKIAVLKVTSLAKKIVGREVEEGLKGLGDPAQNARILQYAKKTLGAAVVSAKFLSEVETKGWTAATGELAIKFSTKFVAKYGAKIAASAVGCTNPVYCAGLFASVIKDALEPTETASAYHDRPPPLPHPPFPLGDQLPQLDPLYPTIRNPK